MTSIRNLNHTRSRAQNVVNRAQNDPDFLSRLVAHPAETLEESGLALEDPREISRESGEVEGYLPRACSSTNCTDYSY